MPHIVIQMYNNVLWDRKYSMKYFFIQAQCEEYTDSPTKHCHGFE